MIDAPRCEYYDTPPGLPDWINPWPKGKQCGDPGLNSLGTDPNGVEHFMCDEHFTTIRLTAIKLKAQGRGLRRWIRE